MKIGDELGGYELLEVLGRGGFGTVYLGRDSSGALGAVKVLHHHYADNPTFRARFRAEVENSKKVAEFCIARVLDADPDGDPPWVVTEYVEGQTLRQAVHSDGEDGGPRSEGDLYRIAVATATALTAIHASGVIHRDFTPSNIMVAPDGIRVIDFGIARALENSPVSASALLGTPRYMAPEQFLGTRVTPAIDVFAWGSVIAFAGTGKDAFAGENLAVTLRKVLFEKPDLKGLPENLAAIVRWCLYKDPQLRPTSDRLLATLLGVEEPDSGNSPDMLAGIGGRPGPDIMAMGTRIGQGSGTIDISAIPTITHAPPDRDELFEFGGESYSSVAALARGIQRDWEKALDLLRSAPLRQDLLRWLPEEREQARRIVAQLPEDWGGADVQAVNLIAELDPALPPLFHGLDMSWGALFGTRDGRAWPYRDRTHERLVHLVEHGNLLEPFSRHHCVQTDHDCGTDRGCGRFARVARQVPVMFDTLRKCEAWLEQLGKGFGLAPAEIPPPGRGDLVHILATDRRAGQGPPELADWAVRGIPEGSERDQVYRAVLNADDPWPAAVAFHAHRDDFRALAERVEQVNEYRRVRPEAERIAGERKRVTAELERLVRRDPGTMVRFFYGLGTVLVVLGALAGVVYWDSLVVLVVVLVVAGVLFGVIGALMARDHEQSVRRVRQELADLPEDAEPPVAGHLAGTDGTEVAPGSGAADGTEPDPVAGEGKRSGEGPLGSDPEATLEWSPSRSAAQSTAERNDERLDDYL
ncbi:serine/threonine-protein kinase [Nocardiopsis terrae]